jgi:hypothetical protein
MIAGECESVLEKSTRRGDSSTQAARLHRPRLLRADALLFSLRRGRQERGDLLT